MIYDIKYDLGIIPDNYYNFNSVTTIHVRCSCRIVMLRTVETTTTSTNQAS